MTIADRFHSPALENPGAPSRTGARLMLLWALAVVVWWGFAFYPVPAGDESWFAVAQSACFGSIPGGPPAAQGWMMLTLAPLLLLVTLLFAYHGEIVRSLPSIARSRAWRAVAVVLLGIVALEGSWAVTRLSGDARRASLSFEPTIREPLPADYPRSADPVPEFRLVDQSGATFDAASLRGEPTVLSFVFAHCQTVCPVLVATLRKAGRELEPGAARMALVTLDPWRDTPAALPGLAERFGLPANAQLVSGEPDDVWLLDQLRWREAPAKRRRARAGWS